MFNNKFLADLLVYGKFSPNPTLEGFPMLGHKHYFFIFKILMKEVSSTTRITRQIVSIHFCSSSSNNLCFFNYCELVPDKSFRLFISGKHSSSLDCLLERMLFSSTQRSINPILGSIFDHASCRQHLIFSKIPFGSQMLNSSDGV